MMSAQLHPQKTLFTLFGIPFTAAPLAWQFVVPKLVIGIIVALLLLPDEPIFIRLLWGVLFGLLLLSVLASHILGHLLSSKLVYPPMTEARITPVLIQTLYQADSDDVTSTTHLIRSLGGPLMNLLLGVIALLAWMAIGGYALLFFSGANFAIAFLVLLPLPSVDGAVIWRELWRLLK